MIWKAILYTPVCLLCVLASCARHGIPMEEVPGAGPSLLVSVGGGFAGRETTYIITHKGALYAKAGADFRYQSMMDARAVQQIFTLYTSQQIDAMQYNEPGNKYYVIEMREKAKTHRIVWGKDPEKPEKLYQYQRFIWSLIQQTVPKQK